MSSGGEDNVIGNGHGAIILSPSNYQSDKEGMKGGARGCLDLEENITKRDAVIKSHGMDK